MPEQSEINVQRCLSRYTNFAEFLNDSRIVFSLFSNPVTIALALVAVAAVVALVPTARPLGHS